MTLPERLWAGFQRFLIPAVLIVASVALVVWFASASPSARRLNEQAFRVLEPALVFVQGPVAAIEDKLAIFDVWQDRHDQLDALRQENLRLKEWYQVAHMLKAENKALKGLLNVEHEAEQSFITAQIMMDTQTPYAHTVMVNSGEGHGVKKGQGVVVGEGLIGRVMESAKDSARVLLLRDVNSRVPVLVEDSNDKAILAGTNDMLPVLEHLSPYHTVKAGQKVITSGHGGVLPYGIAIGETVLNDEGKLAVRLYADPEKSSFVQVVDYGIKPAMAGGAYALAETPTFQ